MDQRGIAGPNVEIHGTAITDSTRLILTAVVGADERYGLGGRIDASIDTIQLHGPKTPKPQPEKSFNLILNFS